MYSTWGGCLSATVKFGSGGNRNFWSSLMGCWIGLWSFFGDLDGSLFAQISFLLVCEWPSSLPFSFCFYLPYSLSNIFICHSSTI